VPGGGGTREHYSAALGRFGDEGPSDLPWFPRKEWPETSPNHGISGAVRMTPVQMGKTRVVGHLILRAGAAEQRYPVQGGLLTLLPAAGVVLREPGRDGLLRDAVRLDQGAVKAASVGRLTRRSRVLEPWSEGCDRPSRLGQVVKGRHDLVLIHARQNGATSGEALWAFELWRGPTESAMAGLAGLRERGDWPPSLEETLPEDLVRHLIRVVRRQGGEPNNWELPI